MRYCKRCVMPDTRPGIVFDSDGVCSACRAYERRQSIDWKQRYKELETLCDKYRGMNGSGWDCAIAVSGGKDSHFQVHLMKEELGMNPILFTVEDNFSTTDAGRHNIKNLSEEFGCNIISLKPDIKLQKKITRYMFETYGKPTWLIDRCIYVFPLVMSLKFNTPLLVYGENVSYEYGGNGAYDTYSALDQLKNGVADLFDLEEIMRRADVSKESLEIVKTPSVEELSKLDPIYISYFIPWNSVSNYEFAKSRGFHDLTHEWNRTHHIESFDQVDSVAYLVHSWMKYPKFGHQFATDYASRFIRYGLLAREDAIKLVEEHDHNLDVKCVRDFCRFAGYTESEFWRIVDKFYNTDLFEKDALGHWRKKLKLV